jgi:hypothetical protein
MQGEVEREYCQRCHDYTNYDIIGYDHRTEIDENVNAPRNFIHAMLRCRGCETVIMRVVQHLEWDDFEPDTFYYCEAIYSKGNISHHIGIGVGLNGGLATRSRTH